MTAKPPREMSEEESDATHDWFLPKMIGYQCCRKCGVMRRYDHKNKPCRGQVRIALRDEYTDGDKV